MKVKVKRNDLQFLGKQKHSVEQQVATVKGSNYHVKPELDLRGERYDDAMLKLEKYLDDVLLAGYANVSIIHGKGTGALRSGVKAFVKNHPRIKSNRPGGAQEGGSGVTIIELK